jgi:nucleoside-triphosphatase THEP1
MKLAYTMAPGRGDTDLVLERLATDLAARGLRCCGTVQINSERADSGPCDMDVRVLPDGAVLRISQDLGSQARGCRLDPAALETAVGLVSARMSSGADLLIVNKFGKHEAEGRGFRDVIAEALAMEIPVLVGLNSLNRPAFEDFAEGLATQLPPEPSALMAWVDEVSTSADELV